MSADRPALRLDGPPPAGGSAASPALWAITCYFNPMRYGRKLANYRLFRKHLAVPLVAVELSFEEDFQLRQGDAERLVQIRGRDVLWHKERLLNVALAALPGECTKVAWLDCDIIFASADWAGDACRLLDDVPVIQLFSRLHHLPRELPGRDAWLSSAESREDSLVAAVATGLSAPQGLQHATMRGVDAEAYTIAKGVAWAGRRELLAAHGFYDAGILGGGDSAMACAAYGNCDIAVQRYHMNEQQAAYYLEWAGPYHEAVRAAASFVDGDVFHLWHGRLCDRRYRARQEGLRRFHFDPFEDVAIDDGGCWKWTSDKRPLHEYVREYFASRKEDG